MAGLAPDLPLQLEELLGVQADNARMGGDLGGVLVVHHAERVVAAATDSNGGGTYCGGGGGGGGFAVRSRQWSLYLEDLQYQQHYQICYRFNVDRCAYNLFLANSQL
jgi:hypothetical protein